LAQDWLLFFAYYSLVSSADSQIKTKNKNTKIWRQNLLSSFLFIFSQFFFPAKKKFRQKLACAQLSAKMQQLNDKTVWRL